MKIILSNTVILNGNRGCVALSYSIIYLLDKLMRDKGVDYELYLPQSGFKEIGKHKLKINDLEIEYTSIMDVSSNKMIKRMKNLVKFKSFLFSKKIYKDADFVMDIGQGDSFADIYGKGRFDWIFSQYELGMKYKKPYCILPQTIGPFVDNEIRKRAVKGIEYSKCVMARDKQSYDFVKELIPNKDVSEIIDVAFFMPYKRKEFDDSYVHVGLNVSSLLWHGGYTQDNQFGLKSDYKLLVRKIIDHFLSQNGVILHLIPHVVSSERGIENDYAVSYDICEEYSNERLVLSPLFLDPISAKNYIAGMDFFMGARMHSTIAAFSSGVPVVPMAYSRKFNGLFADTLEYRYVADMKACNADEILDTIISAYENKDNLRMTINDRMATTVKERKEKKKKNLRVFMGL